MSVLRIIIFIFRGNWAKEGVMQWSLVIGWNFTRPGSVKKNFIFRNLIYESTKAQYSFYYV